jgi:hypothetical protein
MKALRRTVLTAVLVLLALGARGATIEEEMRAVERIRGLRFLAPIRTVEIDRSDLPGRLREQFAKSLPYSIEDWSEVLRALRFVSEDANAEAIVASLLELYQSQVLAYYDPPTKTFYTVRQLPETMKNLPMARPLDAGVAVHELTHALQDQHFAIGKKDLALRDDTDANLAYHALVEGEASLVMLAYMLEQGGGSLEDLIKNDLFTGLLSGASQKAPMEGPRYFVELLKFPYLDGLRFVIEAYRRGGWKELDRVYADPPRSTREIIKPADYFERRFVPAPFHAKPAIAVPHVLSVEHVGQWHWRFLTGDAEGWLGDRVTIAQNQFCEPTVLVETQWDSDEHARHFYDAYTRFLDGSLAKIADTTVRVTYGADRSLMERFLAK